jgi:hypothetical protein
MCGGAKDCGCGCSLNVSDIIGNQASRSEIANKIKINKKEFLNGNLKEIILFTYAVNPKELESKLDLLGLKITEINEDAAFLAKLSELGYDKEGKLKNKMGEPIVFSVIDLLKGIKLDKKLIDRTIFNFV